MCGSVAHGKRACTLSGIACMNIYTHTHTHMYRHSRRVLDNKSPGAYTVQQPVAMDYITATCATVEGTIECNIVSRGFCLCYVHFDRALTNDERHEI